MDNLGSTMRRARAERGWTQADLGEALAADTGLISKRENGKLGVPHEEVERFVAATGIPLVVTPEGWDIWEPPQVALRYYGAVPCGQAIHLADDDEAQEVDLSDLSLGDWDPEACYLLKAAGESMRDAGILDGDWLVVQVPRSLDPPRPGAIVVVSINEETTVKRLGIDPDRDVWTLVPAHPDYEVRDIAEYDEVYLRGTVIGRFRYTRLR